MATRMTHNKPYLHNCGGERNAATETERTSPSNRQAKWTNNLDYSFYCPSPVYPMEPECTWTIRNYSSHSKTKTTTFYMGAIKQPFQTQQ